ncbi:MAG: ferredoxin family protein [Mariniblastus sp.]|jgi:NAD-dependent dihydropyrimidine dehydrogenase PreA subunit|nr:ferredoxin family protein [Mariniblastus sp.]
MSKRISVVVSQSPSKNPAKRKLEEDIVLGLLLEPGIDVTVVPNLYDIKPDSTGMLALQGMAGNMVVVAWLYERATHWILDRNGINGQVGKVFLTSEPDEADDEQPVDKDDKLRVIETREIPDRKIYALDLRSANPPQAFIDEIKRIHTENVVQVVGLGDLTGGLTSTAVASSGDTAMRADSVSATGESVPNRIEAEGGRRWYPVIDYSRCTNCMECVDFCLFGVYGVDRIDTILVEQPDNCRKGCPACSRVCPENAIMFPQHKTPAIAGSAESAASMKIDLSQLFGAPSDGKTAEQIAAIERDEQLILAGRDAVGGPTALPKRHEVREVAATDKLDDLVDQLNDLDI